MAGLKRVFLKICNRIFFRQRVDVEVYSEKTQSWMTVSIPKGRADLVQQELSKLEDKIERPEIPIIPKEPKLLDIGQRNQWIKNIYKLNFFCPDQIGRIIALLGSDYNSVDVLLSVRVPPEVGSRPIQRESIWDIYLPNVEAAEIFDRLGDSLATDFFFEAIDSEICRRRENSLVRSLGFCCLESFVREEFDRRMARMCRKTPDETEFRVADSRRRHLCKKGVIEDWELQLQHDASAGQYFQNCVKAGLVKNRLKSCKSLAKTKEG